jgi:hypothetical protein
MRTWIRNLRGAFARPAGRRPKRWAVPGVEALEERSVPAVVLGVGSGWQSFDWDKAPGTFDNQGAFTFTSAKPTILKVTDAFIDGDQFAVFDAGKRIGTTSVPANDGTQIYDKPDAAFASPKYSHGVFFLPAGDHSLTIETIAIAKGIPEGAAFLRADAAGAEIDINNTPDRADNIVLFNPVPLAQAYTQTIPAKVTNLTGAKATFQLSVTGGGAATLSKNAVTRAPGASAEITITPTADSAAAFDVHVIATQAGATVGGDDMTIVGVTFSEHVRNADTPVSMTADRIPPRVDTPVTVTVTPDLTGSGQSVTLAVKGQSAKHGTVTVDGKATLDITSTGPVNLRGGTQTEAAAAFSAPNAGKLTLVARVRGKDTIKSSGFSVAAIITGVTIEFNGLIAAGGERGIKVDTTYTSDSNVLADLGAVDVSEEVTYGVGTGVFAGVKGDTSGYILATVPQVDQHATPLGLIKAPGGTIQAFQAFKFRDRRTGAQDIPVANSGFIITRTVFTDAGGGVRLTTNKKPAATTVHGITTTAGNGDEISKTQ